MNVTAVQGHDLGLGEFLVFLIDRLSLALGADKLEGDHFADHMLDPVG